MKSLKRFFCQTILLLITVPGFSQYPIATGLPSAANKGFSVQGKLVDKNGNAFVPTICTAAGNGQNRLAVYWSTNPDDLDKITWGSWGDMGNNFLFNQAASVVNIAPYKVFYICNLNTYDFIIGDGINFTSQLSTNTTYYYRFYYFEWANGKLKELESSPIYYFTNSPTPTTTSPTMQLLNQNDSASVLRVSSNTGSYQWYSSSTFNGPYTQITGAVNDNYAPPSNNQTTFYYCQVNGVNNQTVVVRYNSPNITIGSQTWLPADLRATKFNDGTRIPSTTDLNKWINATTPYYYDPGVSGYGYIYNQYVVTGTKNVCPTGYKVPTDAEWTILTSLPAITLAKGDAGWSNINYQAAINSTNFNAWPAGFYNVSSKTKLELSNVGTEIVWWSATNALWYIHSSYVNLTKSILPLDKYGCYIRCIKK